MTQNLLDTNAASTAAARPNANRIKNWIEGNFTKVTVDGVTLDDLSQPLHS